MTASARKEAAKLIRRLRSEHVLSIEDERGMRERHPEALRQLKRMKKEQISTQRLATELYSTDTRYVYELVQNAEDVAYERAKADKIQPFLKFTLFSDRIIVDSNQDGFKAEDIKAICRIGSSTKTGKTKDYIGEKGIGFKSVFNVASRAHIQSEPYSLAFEYRKGLNAEGLGMVTPIQDNYYELPAGVQTRITLTLSDKEDLHAREQELNDLNGALLLFLTKLERLIIDKPAGVQSEEVQFERISERANGKVSIRKTTYQRSKPPEIELMRYFVTQRNVSDLPDDYSKKGIRSASVILAFPVDDRDIPIEQNQDVFAFLPLRQAGFKFLIQSDFVTLSSREDVIDNPRNQALLEQVAEAFRDAVVQFVNGHPLQYLWMRYLPDENIVGGFWADLRPQILQLLEKTRILKSWSRIGLFCPADLRYVEKTVRDDEGMPLFDDLTHELYLAKQYKWRDFKTLRQLGCSVLDEDEIIDRLEADLAKGLDASNMKNPETADAWHSRAASLLTACFHGGMRKHQQRLKRLPLIPSDTGQWVSAVGREQIYFPDKQTSLIPLGTDIAFVQRKALDCPERRNLFQLLGVKECNPSAVVEAIYDKHRTRHWPNYSTSIAVSHLRYLYHHMPLGGKMNKLMTVQVDEDGKQMRVSPLKQHVYANDSKTRHTLFQIFRKSNKLVPGLPICLLDRSYYVDLPSLTYALSWNKWLEEVVGIRSFPAPWDDNSNQLSQEFQYLLEFLPSKFFDILQKNWPQYQTQLPLFEAVLKSQKVKSYDYHRIEIQKAYMPLTNLVEKAHEIGLEEEIFLPVKDNRIDDARAWQFLEAFGVRFTDDLDFYLKGLRYISCQDVEDLDENCVFKIYAGIEKASLSKYDYNKVRGEFEGCKILLPTSEKYRCSWVNLQDCLWKGQEWFESKFILARCPQYQDLSHLFTVILELGNADVEAWLYELLDERDVPKPDTTKILEIYQCLWREADTDDIYDEFEENSLVYIPNKKLWASPSQCIWADESISMIGKESISAPYWQLREFFQGTLEVGTPDISMHVENLKQLAKTQNEDEIKNEIMAIAALDPSCNDVMSLRQANIFPLRSPSVGLFGKLQFTNSMSDWLIADRKHYSDAFAQKDLRILDFSIAESQKILKFLEAMQLSGRLMSTAVQERTIASDGADNVELTNSMRMKAYAIYRCAKHFASPSTETENLDLLHSLEEIVVAESDSIYRLLHLLQDSETYTAKRALSNVHLQDSNDQLKIYVPSDRRRQEVCYFQQLPRELLKHFQISNKSAESVLKGIIAASSLEVIDEILSDEGIPELEGIRRPSNHRKNDLEQQQARSQDQLVSPAASIYDDERDLYAEILEHLISASVHLTIPSNESVSCNSEPTLLMHTFQHIQFSTQLERDISVGAAGELLIFELLDSYELPYFSIDNWRSKIRNRARVHTSYTGLEPWDAAETSDIVYRDKMNKFTHMLRVTGYLENQKLAPDTTYFIEVKTTTGRCSDVFYMNEKQYRQMQKMKLNPQVEATQVMIIARVFNVDKQGVGVRFFVDPASLEENEELHFSGKKWAVRCE